MVRIVSNCASTRRIRTVIVSSLGESSSTPLFAASTLCCGSVLKGSVRSKLSALVVPLNLVRKLRAWETCSSASRNCSATAVRWAPHSRRRFRTHNTSIATARRKPTDTAEPAIVAVRAPFLRETVRPVESIFYGHYLGNFCEVFGDTFWVGPPGSTAVGDEGLEKLNWVRISERHDELLQSPDTDTVYWQDKGSLICSIDDFKGVSSLHIQTRCEKQERVTL
jgi:hypothetical protein